MGLRGEAPPEAAGGLRLLLETQVPGSSGRIAQADGGAGDLPSALAFVLASQPEERWLTSSQDNIDFAAVGRHVAAAVSTAASDERAGAPAEPASGAAAAGEAEASASSSADSSSGPASSSGRLGPRDVVLAEIRGSCDMHDSHLLSRANFSTLRGRPGLACCHAHLPMTC